MKDYIEGLIKRKTETYRADYAEMLGDFNRELETIKGYNGRQLLELLQNCDDEGSLGVSISLDRDKRTVTITNSGSPFSENGYRSLFIANLSSKRDKKQYIGNKGLGFRSIINWSEAIEIQSNGLSLRYSEANKNARFDELFSKECQQTIRENEGIADWVVPMPFLYLPEFNDIEQPDKITSIIITYRDSAINDILHQINQIAPTTLLFLKHVERICFSGFEDKPDILCKKVDVATETNRFSPIQEIMFDDSTWDVFGYESKLPKEYTDGDHEKEAFYQIKIAVDRNFTKSSPFLYSFFPTNIQLRQPYVLHATFELDSTRNQLVNSNRNIFILQQVVDFTVQIAKHFAKGEVSYKPLEILTHIHKADTLLGLGYYEAIAKAIRQEKIFPCLDNEYRVLEEVIYVSDEFAEMLLCTNGEHILYEHIHPLEDRELKDFGIENEIDRSVNKLDNYIGVINGISSLAMDSSTRACFIGEIVKNCSYIKKDFPNALNFLLNDSNNIIAGTEYVYVSLKNESRLKVPAFADIQFLNRALLNHLLEVFEFKTEDDGGKTRFIAERLSGFCNIHSYEPIPLAQKIVGEANRKLKEEQADSKAIVREMNNCLFQNFLLMDTDTRRNPLRVAAIPSITSDTTIRSTKDLFLSDQYPGGRATKLIFGGIYHDSDYVGSPNNLGLESRKEMSLVEDYLKWIGVNAYAKYEKGSPKESYTYFQYIRKLKNIKDSTQYQTDCYSISNIDSILTKITANQLIIWIHFDELFQRQLKDYANEDIVKNYFRGWYPPIQSKPSYLKFLIKTKYNVKFDEMMLDERFAWMNTWKIDYRAKEFVNLNISKADINAILSLLDAKDDFVHLSIEKIGSIINSLPAQYKDGKGTQSIYKKALVHYKKHQKEIGIPISVFANNGNGLAIYPSQSVFFSDRIKLPKRLRKEYPIFNFPPRSGGADAIKFFKINDLSQIKLAIVHYNVLEGINDEFKEYLDKIKPLLLAQRISSTEEASQRKIQLSICQRIEVVLCSYIEYRIKDSEGAAADYEFLNSTGHTYYVRIKPTDSVDSLRRNSAFIESFSDLVSLSFDIPGEKNDFKNLLRYNYDEAEANIKTDYGEDVLQEARELLGLTDYKIAFWTALFESIGVASNNKLDDASIEDALSDHYPDLKFNIQSLDYEHLNSSVELLKLKAFFASLNLALSDFSRHYLYTISLEKYHLHGLKNMILSKKPLVKSSLWRCLFDEPPEKQATFLEIANRLENYQDFAQKAAKQAEHIFELDYDAISRQFIWQLYGELELTDEINLSAIKQANLAGFTIDDRDKINADEQLRSLAYFANAIQTIESKLVATPSNQPNQPPNGTPAKKVQIQNSDKLKTGVISGNSRSKGSGRPWFPRQNDGKRKEQGDTSEQIVYDYLVANGYKNVYRASEGNEGLHYDIRYTAQDGVVKYVEVKTFDSGSFHLSASQYDFGKENKEDYEIWLVQAGENIFPIRDFFTNDKYVVQAEDYLVFLDVE